MKKEIKYLLEEWKMLNQYVQNQQNSLFQIWGGLNTIFIGAVIAIALLDNKTHGLLGIAAVLIPLMVICFFTYTSYQFRLIAVSRGYLCCLEKRINAELNDNIYLWHCVFHNKFIADKNLINKNFKYPFICTSCMVYIFCLYLIWQ